MANQESSSAARSREQEEIDIPPISKSTAGAATGAVVGAVAGPVGAVVGGVVGAVVGRRIGKGKPALPRALKRTAVKAAKAATKAVKKLPGVKKTTSPARTTKVAAIGRTPRTHQRREEIDRQREKNDWKKLEQSANEAEIAHASQKRLEQEANEQDEKPFHGGEKAAV